MILYEYQEYEAFESACLEAKENRTVISVFTPIPMEELMKKMEMNSLLISLAAVAGGGLGFLTAVGLTIIPSLYTFPLNVGGRPLNSWPAFLVIAFELSVLFSGFAALGAFLLVNRFPRYDKEVFSVPEFNQRKDQHFFLLVKKELKDAKALGIYHLPLPL